MQTWLDALWICSKSSARGEYGVPEHRRVPLCSPASWPAPLKARPALTGQSSPATEKLNGAERLSARGQRHLLQKAVHANADMTRWRHLQCSCICGDFPKCDSACQPCQADARTRGKNIPPPCSAFPRSPLPQYCSSLQEHKTADVWESRTGQKASGREFCYQPIIGCNLFLLFR